MKKIAISVFVLVFVFVANAANKETLKYADCEGKALYLDHYSNGDTVFSRGCVIFVFGGGFAAGSRDDKYYISYFDWLCENGYDVVFRGLRSEKDFNYEIELAQIYAKFYNGKAETLYLMTDPRYSY
ncbi:MAG: hypothetical protein Q4A15_07990, partial [Prevotellaceae bacterium]|nr:hypothetical protein [Prevotellaceae bacterium]